VSLTGRQREFLAKLVDLYRQANKPLHYSLVAERLGVSPMTAYDMLRLLQERGLVASQYVLPEGGAGRSMIAFSPTAKAADMTTRAADQDWDRDEWQTLKAQILRRLRRGSATNRFALLDELLLRLPDRRAPMLFVTEMITAILLTLYQLAESQTKDGGLVERMRALGLPKGLGLNALAGLTVGLSLVERANRRVTSFLLSNSQKYQDYLEKLSAENRARLSDFVRDIVRIMETEWNQPRPGVRSSAVQLASDHKTREGYV